MYRYMRKRGMYCISPHSSLVLDNKKEDIERVVDAVLMAVR